MKHIIVTAAAILMFACNNNIPQQDKPVMQETPKVLQEESDVKSSFKRSYGSDLFEELYAELSEKDPDLKALNQGLEKHWETHKDSLQPFDSYKEKSKRYYRSAGQKLENINDSTLRLSMSKLMKLSEMTFDNRIMGIERLIQTISENNISLNDHHIALKMVATLKSIEKFQKDGMVGTDDLKNVIKEQNKLIAELQKKAK
jgi:hypothetical protein